MQGTDTNEKRAAILRKLHHDPLRSSLPPEVLHQLETMAEIRHYPAGATILAQGEKGEIVGNVVSGIVKLERLLSDGRQQIVALLAPTDMFGRVEPERLECAVEAATDVTLCCFDRRRFAHLLETSPALQKAVLFWVLDELDAAREWLGLIAGETVKARLATYILMLCRRWPNQALETAAEGPVLVSLAVARPDLAHFLGTTVESISRNLQSMVRDGLIRQHGASRLEILDLGALVAASGHSEFSADTLQAAFAQTRERQLFGPDGATSTL